MASTQARTAILRRNPLYFGNAILTPQAIISHDYNLRRNHKFAQDKKKYKKSQKQKYLELKIESQAESQLVQRYR